MHPGRVVRAMNVALILLALSVCRVALADEAKFPYKALVSDQGAAVHSGNGPDYYVTNRLESGTPVLVHRHDPNGWRMIAPPEEAFSLVPTGGIERLDGNRARIRSDDVATRVGSAVGEEFGVEQIPLRIGMRVEVLPDHETPDGWVAIVPPRGEYRWVRAEELRKAEPETKSITEDAATQEKGTARSVSLSELDKQLAGLEDNDPARWNLEALSLKYLRLKRSHLDLAREVDARLARIAELKIVRAKHLGIATSPDDHMAMEATPVQEKLPERAEPTGTEYYPTNIGSRGSEESPSPTGQTFEESGPRLSESADPPAPDWDWVETTPPNQSADAGAAPPSKTPARRSAAKPESLSGKPRRFDAVGFVQKAIDPPAGAPAYVLLSKEGRILAHLQPPPNTSFESFVGIAMGVDGTRRQRQGLQLPLISVERLTPVRFD